MPAFPPLSPSHLPLQPHPSPPPSPSSIPSNSNYLCMATRTQGFATLCTFQARPMPVLTKGRYLLSWEEKKMIWANQNNEFIEENYRQPKPLRTTTKVYLRDLQVFTMMSTGKEPKYAKDCFLHATITDWEDYFAGVKLSDVSVINWLNSVLPATNWQVVLCYYCHFLFLSHLTMATNPVILWAWLMWREGNLTLMTQPSTSFIVGLNPPICSAVVRFCTPPVLPYFESLPYVMLDSQPSSRC